MTQETQTSIDEVIKNYAHLFISYGMLCNLSHADETINESIEKLSKFVKDSINDVASTSLDAYSQPLTTLEQLRQLAPDTPIQGTDNRGMLKILAQKSSAGVWSSTYKTPVTPEQLLMLCEKGFVVLAPQTSGN